MLVHGFADLTGVAADFLEEVLRVVGGIVLLDRFAPVLPEWILYWALATGRMLAPFVPLKVAVLLMTALGVVATMAWTAGLSFNFVCESHHAMGVPITTRTSVVTSAS